MLRLFRKKTGNRKQVMPVPPRHSVEQLEDGVRILLPSQKSIWKLLWSGFMSLYTLAFMLLVLIFVGLVITILFEGGFDILSILIFGGFLLFSLAFTEFITLLAIYSFLWQLGGREVFEIKSESLFVTKQVYRWGWTKEYSHEAISDIGISKVPPAFFNSFNELLQKHGVIGIDYGARTYRFGLDIHEAEAKMIIAALKPYIPHLNKM